MTTYLERLVERAAGPAPAAAVQPPLRDAGASPQHDPFAAADAEEFRSAGRWPSQPARAPTAAAGPNAVDTQAIAEPGTPPKTVPSTVHPIPTNANPSQSDVARIEPVPGNSPLQQRRPAPEADRPKPDREAQESSVDQHPRLPHISRSPTSGEQQRLGAPEQSHFSEKALSVRSRRPQLDPLEPTVSRTRSTELRLTPQAIRSGAGLDSLQPPSARETSASEIPLSELERVVEQAVEKKAQRLQRSLQPSRSETVLLEPQHSAPPPFPQREEPRVIVRTERVEVVRPPAESARMEAAHPPRPSRSSSRGRSSYRLKSKLRFGLGQM